jgi:hypothetical protein
MHKQGAERRKQGEEMDDLSCQTSDLLEHGDSLELSLVELVVAASDHSEDQYEISDLVDGLIETGRVTVREAA